MFSSSCFVTCILVLCNINYIHSLLILVPRSSCHCPEENIIAFPWSSKVVCKSSVSATPLRARFSMEYKKEFTPFSLFRLGLSFSFSFSFDLYNDRLISFSVKCFSFCSFVLYFLFCAPNACYAEGAYSKTSEIEHLFNLLKNLNKVRSYCVYVQSSIFNYKANAGRGKFLKYNYSGLSFVHCRVLKYARFLMHIKIAEF